MANMNNRREGYAIKYPAIDKKAGVSMVWYGMVGYGM